MIFNYFYTKASQSVSYYYVCCILHLLLNILNFKTFTAKWMRNADYLIFKTMNITSDSSLLYNWISLSSHGIEFYFAFITKYLNFKTFTAKWMRNADNLIFKTMNITSDPSLLYNWIFFHMELNSILHLLLNILKLF